MPQLYRQIAKSHSGADGLFKVQLWEMTFYGFSQEKIQKFMDDMKESIRSGERHTFDNIEDLFAELDQIDEDPTPQDSAGD